MALKKKKVFAKNSTEEVKNNNTLNTATNNDYDSFEEINEEINKTIEEEKCEIDNGTLEDVEESLDINCECEEVDKRENVSNYNLANFIPSKSKSTERVSGEAGVLTIVYAKTGVRLSLPTEVYQKLNAPDKLQFSFSGDAIAIVKKLPNTENSYNVRRSGSRAIVYSAPLVKEIINYFKLNFEGRTSVTFNEVEYVFNEDYSVAIIKIR